MTVKVYKSPVKEFKMIDKNKLKITTNQGEVAIFTIKSQNLIAVLQEIEDII